MEIPGQLHVLKNEEMTALAKKAAPEQFQRP